MPISQVFVWIILITNGFSVFLAGSWDTATFITSYLPIALFFVLFFGHKIIMKNKIIAYDEMDFYTGSRIGIEEHEDAPRNWVEKYVNCSCTRVSALADLKCFNIEYGRR
jgi:amino acid transporter